MSAICPKEDILLKYSLMEKANSKEGLIRIKGKMWDVDVDVGCGMWDVGCGMWDVRCGM
jgi:hypothetical protein